MVQYTAPKIRLSEMCADSMVRAAFLRAELDGGDAFAVPARPLPTLNGGEAAEVELIAVEA